MTPSYLKSKISSLVTEVYMKKRILHLSLQKKRQSEKDFSILFQSTQNHHKKNHSIQSIFSNNTFSQQQNILSIASANSKSHLSTKDLMQNVLINILKMQRNKREESFYKKPRRNTNEHL